MGEEDQIRRERVVVARTNAIIAALPKDAQRLFIQEDTSRTASRYQVFRSIVYELVDGAYGEGYVSGEDRLPMEGDIQ